MNGSSTNAAPASDSTTFDKSTIADLVAQYGSSSATAWLEFERYKIWRPSEPIPESDFPPVQGYMQKDPYIFAWGNPLVSSSAALLPTARAFISFVESQDLRPVWCCVDQELEDILGSPEFDWSTVSCIYEDVVDPEKVIELTSPENKGQEGQKLVKDLKKNLNKAKKQEVQVAEVKEGAWSESEKREVEQGMQDWKANKSGVQIASTTGQPWIDEEHRRYWLAKKDAKVVGILILTPIHGGASWQIKNAVSFPSAPKGTSEALIYTALEDLYHENQANGAAANGAAGTNEATTNGNVSASTPSSTSTTSSEDEDKLRQKDRVTLTFGISAADALKPVRNLGGWKVSALSKTYGKVASTAGLVKRGEFRSKFASEPQTMYVCYPPDGFGLDGVNALLKVLRK